MRIFRQGGRVVLHMVALLVALSLACSMLFAGVSSFAVSAASPDASMKVGAKDGGPVLSEVSDPTCISSQPLDFELSPDKGTGYVFTGGGTVCAVDLKTMKIKGVSARISDAVSQAFDSTVSFTAYSHPVFSVDGEAMYVESNVGLVAFNTVDLTFKILPVSAVAFSLSSDETKILAIVMGTGHSNPAGSSGLRDFSLIEVDVSTNQIVSNRLLMLPQPADSFNSYGVSQDGSTWYLNTRMSESGALGIIDAVDVQSGEVSQVVLPSTDVFGPLLVQGTAFAVGTNDTVYISAKSGSHWYLIALNRADGQVRIVRGLRGGDGPDEVVASRDAPIVMLRYSSSAAPLVVDGGTGKTIAYKGDADQLTDGGREAYAIDSCGRVKATLPLCLTVSSLDGSRKHTVQRLRVRSNGTSPYDVHDFERVILGSRSTSDGNTFFALMDGNGRHDENSGADYTNPKASGHLIKILVRSANVEKGRPKFSVTSGTAIGERKGNTKRIWVAVGIGCALVLVLALVVCAVLASRQRKHSKGQHVQI